MKGLRAVLTTTLLLLFGAAPVVAQKRPLDHDAYDRWNRIQGQSLSPDGEWLSYSLVPGDGDGQLRIQNLEDGSSLMVERGTNPSFTDDSRFLVFTIRPTQEALEEEDGGGRGGRGGGGGRGGRGGQGAQLPTRNRNADRQGPADTLAIADLEAVFRGGSPSLDAIIRIPQVESFLIPDEDASLVAYLETTEPAEDEDNEEEGAQAQRRGGRRGQGGGGRRGRGGAGGANDDDEDEDEKAVGAPLVLRDLASGEESRFENVTAFALSEDGSSLYYAASNEDGTADGVYRVDTSSGAATPLLTGEGEYSRLTTARSTGAVAFLTNRDDFGADQPAVTLFVAGVDEDEARALVSESSQGIPQGSWIADGAQIRFSDSGSRVFFGTAPRPEPEDDEEDDEEEMPVVDIWNWKDPYLQPMQLVQLTQERNRTFDAMVPFAGGAVVQLETPDLASVEVGDGGDADVAMGETDLPYRQLVSWDGRYNDVYVVDVETGARRLVVEAARGFGGGTLSPTGRYITWWDGAEKTWYAIATDGGSGVDISADMPFPVHNELDDHPDDPPPYGSGGWTENDEAFLVYDRHDLWSLDPTGQSAPVSLTRGLGRQAGLRLRYIRTDPELDFVPTEKEILLSAFHLTTKESGFYRDRLGDSRPPSEALFGPYRYSNPRKAEDSDRFLLTRQTFQEFPDLWVSDTDFEEMEKVSEANPQQDEYVWGTAEIVEWTSNDGIPLQGILYKPEGFDPSQQYPMMVFFYERNSDGLHGYTVPAAGSSSINRSFYVSRGYLLFVPDIPYEIGHPGESALDAVVPGVLSIMDEGFVNADKIGVQGHSWGGYQIAYMITRTNLFTAAEAGAPVSNMTSAYGGIRWQSGMSRMFQYERTQSRIGGTLWNAQQLYITNSPIFAVDKIQTPLLMMHNDEDGAVPWYQGIEMFVSMRRLQKPVWMLNYNGEAHGLRQEVNQRDWATRMQQFFDHYLQDADPPVWMVDGVPAILKGKTLGLQLVKKPITEQEQGGRR